MGLDVAIIGAGWAGLAAAVRATEAGHRVTLFEIAPQVGGRARSIVVDGSTFDNGQHILIGAYVRTLALMRTVGADAQALLLRRPLTLRYPDGRGLAVPEGPPTLSLVCAILRCAGLGWLDRWSLGTHTMRWAATGFRCDPQLTVDQLCRRLAPRARELLIEPLCIAAMNTPAAEASGSVFLRVLKDALLGARGSADLMLPRQHLDALLSQPARRWLSDHGARLMLRTRVQKLEPRAGRWSVDDAVFDRVVLACSSAQASMLARPHAATWAAAADALHYEPIVTVYLQCDGAVLDAPMLALHATAESPAQFVFDHGCLSDRPGVLACVISGARAWVDLGMQRTEQAVCRQISAAFAHHAWAAAPRVLATVAEKRATFRCTTALVRPSALVAPNLFAAGDYVDGPYPATLEGAVRSGEAAAALIDS